MTTDRELRIGDRIKDNDPRCPSRVLTIVELTPTTAITNSTIRRGIVILRHRIHTDGKPRRSGFDLLQEEYT